MTSQQMSPSKTAKHKPAQRRTQEERSATTREKVINAAIDCIVEEGLHNATAARIAARSGVTWGAIVHQFGDKDSVLLAVIERNTEVFLNYLTSALQQAGSTLPERMNALIDVTWKYINEPAAFAFNELVIYNRVSKNPQMMMQQQQLTNRQAEIMWDKFFGEFDIAPAAVENARNYTLATLLGLSVLRLMSSRPQAYMNEIATLKKFAVQLLVQPDSALPSRTARAR